MWRRGALALYLDFLRSTKADILVEASPVICPLLHMTGLLLEDDALPLERARVRGGGRFYLRRWDGRKSESFPAERRLLLYQ